MGISLVPQIHLPVVSKLLANCRHGYCHQSITDDWQFLVSSSSLTQDSISFSVKGSRGLMQEIFALAGTLTIATPPPPDFVVTFRHATSHRFGYTIMASDRSNAYFLA